MFFEFEFSRERIVTALSTTVKTVDVNVMMVTCVWEF